VAQRSSRRRPVRTAAVDGAFNFPVRGESGADEFGTSLAPERQPRERYVLFRSGERRNEKQFRVARSLVGLSPRVRR